MTLSKVGTFIFYILSYVIASASLQHSKKKKFDIFFAIAILIPSLIAGFRRNVGTDFLNYRYIYNYLSSLSFTEWLSSNFGVVDGNRIGLWTVAKIAALFNSPKVFYGILGFLSVLPAAIFIKDYFEEKEFFFPYFIFLLTTFSSGLNITKQAIAISFVILSLKFVFSRKFVLFLLCICLAMSFHVTSLLAVVLYFLYSPDHQSITKLKKVLLFGAIVLLMVFYDTILKFLGGRFASYNTYSGDISNKSFFLNFALLVFFFCMDHACSKVDKRYHTLLFVYAIGITLMLLGFVSPYLKRIAGYFTCAGFILLTTIPKAMHGKNKIIVSCGIALYEITIFIITYFVLGQAAIVPYSFG